MNAPRYAGRPGHVESWFLRANHPSRPLAVWIKLTILAPLPGPAGAPPPVLETWLVYFDGENGTTFAHKDTHPLDRTSLASPDASADVVLSAGRFVLDLKAGTVRGAAGAGSFDLQFSPVAGSVARPLCLLPYDWMLRSPFPKSKLLTPLPALMFSGALTIGGATVAVDGWSGMEGHNWGKEHAFEYVWGQCVFPESVDPGGAGPAVVVEAFSARVRVGGMLTPRLSALVVRRGDEEHRFDSLVDVWRQEATVNDVRWTLRMRGPAGEVRLRVDGTGRPMVCLGYRNPDGRLAYCRNSKLADTLVEVRPARSTPFHASSAHGGALELLGADADPALPVV